MIDKNARPFYNHYRNLVDFEADLRNSDNLLYEIFTKENTNVDAFYDKFKNLCKGNILRFFTYLVNSKNEDRLSLIMLYIINNY